MKIILQKMIQNYKYESKSRFFKLITKQNLKFEPLFDQ